MQEWSGMGRKGCTAIWELPPAPCCLFWDWFCLQFPSFWLIFPLEILIWKKSPPGTGGGQMCMLAKGFAGGSGHGESCVSCARRAMTEAKLDQSICRITWYWFSISYFTPYFPASCVAVMPSQGTGSQPQHPREHLQQEQQEEWEDESKIQQEQQEEWEDESKTQQEQQEEWEDESKTGVVANNRFVWRAEKCKVSSACPTHGVWGNSHVEMHLKLRMEIHGFSSVSRGRKLEVHVTLPKNHCPI